MTDTRLTDVLNGKEDNYLLPFYWQHGNHTGKIPEQIARIRQSGCRALCVEARPHPEFCEAGWWRDMDIILDECRKRDMRVWILDDKHFPTGYANGAIEKKYPHLRAWNFFERHIDVMGPAAGNSLLLRPSTEEEQLICAVAYRRVPDLEEQKLTGEPVVLTGLVHGGTLTWDIPDGCWRVFFVYRTRWGIHDNYIDLINPESCAVQLEAVYEPHYAHYAKYFGNVIAGFFSDEPQFGNVLNGRSIVDLGPYHYAIGHEGLGLPYSEKLLEMMSAELGGDATQYLGELWYESEHAPLTRHAYMNALTRLYRDSFSRPVGDWCRAHGVEYIGHVIEDMGTHTRMGYGTGHYFRALEGQDMGGIDIVLHQVMPGFANYIHTATGLGGAYTPLFFDYVLGKLAASISHQIPRMKGRAMCEVFGAYGWGEGATMMKWLIDFLLVRGINHFVPHAFSPEFPDGDCPPHFGAEGHDPQFDGFAALMGYTNKMAHLLSGGRHIASVALLYHAEGEWMSKFGKSMPDDKPARALYDDHIDFDIVCADTLLENAAVENGRLRVADETFGALVVPASGFLPQPLLDKLAAFARDGLDIIYVESTPAGVNAAPVPLNALAATVRDKGLAEITFAAPCPFVRCYHIVRDGHDVFMFFNESYAERARTQVRLPAKGAFARLMLLDGIAESDATDDGTVALDLLPGQSAVLVFGSDAALPAHTEYTASTVLAPTYGIEVADADDLAAFRPYATTNELFNVNAPGRLPDFSGKIRYTFSFDADGRRPCALDLGTVGQTARLWLNGHDMGIRIAPPYRFEIGDFIREGVNEAVVETANTLAQKVRDQFTFFLQLAPAGLLGPVKLMR